MTPNPRGGIVRTIRISESDGDGTKRTVSGAGVIIRLKSDVPGSKPSSVRRDFTKTARKIGVVIQVVELTHGHYSQSGNVIAERAPSAYQCVGTLEQLTELMAHYSVDKTHFALSVRATMGAQGSGPEKIRPSSGTAFGRPETIAATATELARLRTERMTAQRAAGNI